MRVRLDEEDRRAVDLLLERASGIGDTPPVEQLFSPPVAPGFERRLDAAEAILSILDHLPADEPPADLVVRTMERIHQAETHDTADVMSMRPTFPSQRPHA